MLKIASPCRQSFQRQAPTPAQKIVPTDVQASTKPSTSQDTADRLSRTPSSLIGYSTEWLPISNSCQLMQTNKLIYHIVWQFYARRLTSQPPGFGSQLFWYHYLPARRLDHYTATDQRGLAYLNTKGIYYPLTERIRKKELTIKQALGYIADRRCLIQASLNNPDITQQQKILLRNSLFQEHIVNGRCSIRNAIKMAGGQWHLFYSMTLQSLFRCGQLNLQDLAQISNHGLQLLHDPMGARLYSRGLISKQQVLSLTATGLSSILLCLPVLQSKTSPIREVLALTEEQITSLCETGLAEEVHTGRMALADALDRLAKTAQSTPMIDDVTKSVCSSLSVTHPDMVTSATKSISSIEISDLPDLPLVSSPDITMLTASEALSLLMDGTHKSLREVILSESADYRVRWIRTFGMIIHRLSIDDLIRFLDTSSWTSQSVFDDLDEGLDETEVADLAQAYLQIYIDLAQRLSSNDYLRVVRPFIKNVFGHIAGEAFIYDHPAILSQCGEFWSRVRSKCGITGHCVGCLRELVRPLLDCHMQSGSIAYLSETGMANFGQLLYLMGFHQTDLHLDEVLFSMLPIEWTVENWLARENGTAIEVDFLRALLSPFEKNNPDIALFFAELDPKS